MMTLKAAREITGSLGHPAKMPGLSYGISADKCITGSKLAKIPGSVCHGCYALKCNYKYPSVKKAHDKRIRNIHAPEWVVAMVRQISAAGETYFRWHDSGDLQSLQHLLNIVRIAEQLPLVSFWLPTREKGMIAEFLRTFGHFPLNLVVRVSAAMVDGQPCAEYPNTSTVHDKAEPVGHVCPASNQGNRCNDCRACWDRSVANVSYHKH